MRPDRALASLAISLALLFAPVQAGAVSITTQFESDNHGNLGGAIYFDVLTGDNELTIEGFETNTNKDGSFGFQVYLLEGTSTGNELDAGLWTLAATGSGVGGGLDNPSLITLDNVFLLDANTTYGMAIVLDGVEGTARHYYTNGTGANQFYADSDLTLQLGSASNIPFNDPFFDPRVWNGTITYTVAASPQPEPVSWLLFGIGSVVVGTSVWRKSQVA